MSVSSEGAPYHALVILKMAEPAGLRLAYRNPPPALVVPVVPGVTTKGAFVRAIIRQVIHTVTVPDHILNMPRGTGPNGLPLETVMTSTAKNVQIVWAVCAPPPPGFGGSNSSALPSTSTNPFFEARADPTKFQAVTSLADLSDAQFHDCLRKMQSREAHGREDYFVMEVQFGYEEQKKKQKQVKEGVENLKPLSPSHYPHSKQYEEEQKNLQDLVAASSSGLMGVPSSGNRDLAMRHAKTPHLPTVEEEPEDDGQVKRIEEEKNTDRASGMYEVDKGKQIARLPPLPRTPVDSPLLRQQQTIPSTPKAKDKDDRPETYTPDVWDIDKTVLDTRIASHEQQESPDDKELQQRRPTSRDSSKSRIPGISSFHLPLSRGRKKPSSPPLSDDRKK